MTHLPGVLSGSTRSSILVVSVRGLRRGCESFDGIELLFVLVDVMNISVCILLSLSISGIRSFRGRRPELPQGVDF
jgi:hypothetical protein